MVSAEQQQLLAQVENAVAYLKPVHSETYEELHAARKRAEQQLLLLVAQVEKAVASLEAIHRETHEELNMAMQLFKKQQQLLITQASRESETCVLSCLARGDNEEEAGPSGI